MTECCDISDNYFLTTAALYVTDVGWQIFEVNGWRMCYKWCRELTTEIALVMFEAWVDANLVPG